MVSKRQLIWKSHAYVAKLSASFLVWIEGCPNASSPAVFVNLCVTSIPPQAADKVPLSATGVSPALPTPCKTHAAERWQQRKTKPCLANSTRLPLITEGAPRQNCSWWLQALLCTSSREHMLPRLLSTRESQPDAQLPPCTQRTPHMHSIARAQPFYWSVLRATLLPKNRDWFLRATAREPVTRPRNNQTPPAPAPHPSASVESWGQFRLTALAPFWAFCTPKVFKTQTLHSLNLCYAYLGSDQQRVLPSFLDYQLRKSQAHQIHFQTRSDTVTFHICFCKEVFVMNSSLVCPVAPRSASV